MATSRLPFLYPNLLRSVKSCEPSTYYRSIRYPPRCKSAAFHTTQPYEQETIHQRYGPAVETRLNPPPWPKDKSGSPPPGNPPKEVTGKGSERGKEQGSSSSSAQSQESTSSNQQQVPPRPGDDHSTPESASPANIAAELGSQGEPRSDSDPVEAVSAAEAEPDAAQKPGSHASGDRLDSIFKMSDSPKESSSSRSDSSSAAQSAPESEHHKPPHISPPAYVHHFDTYTLVKDLAKEGFTEEQSVQIMKGIRGLLADHLTMAKEGLYSKSDFENESYLFRAACSELRNSLQTSRNAEIQAQRSRRAQLQHESDILSQRLNQELTGLNDNLKEMFNDQKIWTRETQRSLDTAIQELNYKITVSLHSDGRSEVESLRWVLTRRAALAIGTSAAMIILALRYYSYKKHESEVQKKAAEAAAVVQAAEDSSFDALKGEASRPQAHGPASQ